MIIVTDTFDTVERRVAAAGRWIRRAQEHPHCSVHLHTQRGSDEMFPPHGRHEHVDEGEGDQEVPHRCHQERKQTTGALVHPEPKQKLPIDGSGPDRIYWQHLSAWASAAACAVGNEEATMKYATPKQGCPVKIGYHMYSMRQHVRWCLRPAMKHNMYR